MRPLYSSKNNIKSGLVHTLSFRHIIITFAATQYTAHLFVSENTSIMLFRVAPRTSQQVPRAARIGVDI